MSLRCTVVSLVPFQIGPEQKPGLIPPSFTIKASDGHTPTLLHIETATHFVYLDESRGNLQVKNPPDIVARAIVEDYVSSQLGIDDNSGPALFWSPEDLKISDFEYNLELKTQLARMKIRQRSWFVNITKMADDDWRRYHQHNVVSDFQRRIAEVLELDPKDHEWMSPLKMLEETNKTCPFCSSSIPKEAIVCSICSNVVDPKRKKELETSIAR